MKNLILTLSLAMSGSAFASQGYVGDIPTSSQWALAMINMACGTQMSEEAGFVGQIDKANGNVLYTAYMGGALQESAEAKSTFILAKKTCTSND